MTAVDYAQLHGIELTVDDIRLIHLCRLIGFGVLSEVTVHDGVPRRAVRAVSNFDFQKDLTIRVVPKDQKP